MRADPFFLCLPATSSPSTTSRPTTRRSSCSPTSLTTSRATRRRRDSSTALTVPSHPSTTAFGRPSRPSTPSRRVDRRPSSSRPSCRLTSKERSRMLASIPTLVLPLLLPTRSRLRPTGSSRLPRGAATCLRSPKAPVRRSCATATRYGRPRLSLSQSRTTPTLVAPVRLFAARARFPLSRTSTSSTSSSSRSSSCRTRLSWPSVDPSHSPPFATPFCASTSLRPGGRRATSIRCRSAHSWRRCPTTCSRRATRTVQRGPTVDSSRGSTPPSSPSSRW